MERATGTLEYLSNLFGTIGKRKRRKQFQTVELKVKIDCDGCERKVKRALSSMSGVKTVDINRKMHKVTVAGYVEPNKVLKKVKGTGKRAELWPYVPYNSVTQPFSAQTYDKIRAPSGHVRKGSFNTISDSNQDDPFTTMFSDEDPNSCTIM